MIKNEPDELNGKADPEEQVELHQTEEDLVMRVHGLDPNVSSEIFVHLPSKLGVDLVSQAYVGAFSDSDDDGYDSSEIFDGYMRESRGVGRDEALYFSDLNDRVCQQNSVEDTGVKSK